MNRHPAVAKKRLGQQDSIPPTWRLPPITLLNAPKDTLSTIRSCDILTPDELSWTETNDVAVLVSLLAKREVSSEQLTAAFCKRAAIAQQLNRCLTEIFFERALGRARQLDEFLVKTGKVVGPLHGLPISIKDRFDVEGIDSTVGMYSYLYTYMPWSISVYLPVGLWKVANITAQDGSD